MKLKNIIFLIIAIIYFDLSSLAFSKELVDDGGFESYNVLDGQSVLSGVMWGIWETSQYITNPLATNAVQPVSGNNYMEGKDWASALYMDGAISRNSLHRVIAGATYTMSVDVYVTAGSGNGFVSLTNAYNPGDLIPRQFFTNLTPNQWNHISVTGVADASQSDQVIMVAVVPNDLGKTYFDNLSVIETVPSISKTQIVISDSATLVENFAAQELQKYIEQVSGEKVPIVAPSLAMSSIQLTIGTPADNTVIATLLAGSGEDAYLVKADPCSSPKKLFLCGNKPQGALFATYDFLENQFGIRFYGFGNGYGDEIVPNHAFVITPVNRMQTPSVKYRISNNNNFSLTDATMLELVADWSAKNRFNVFLTTDTKDVSVDALQKRGFEIWGPGHIWGSLIPQHSLFTNHPEYFPLINGSRQETGISFCYSNQTALNYFVNNALAYAKARPELSCFACWPQDGSQRWAQCQCQYCRQYTFSQWNLKLINAIAQAFAGDAQLKNMRIQWIAYDEASPPPYNVVPYNDKIDLLYCNSIRDFRVSVNSVSNQHVPLWLMLDEFSVNVNTDFKTNPTDADLASLPRLESMASYLSSVNFKGNASILEYYNQSVGIWLNLPYLQYVQSGPWPNDVMENDFKLYQQKGFNGWLNCVNWLNYFPDPYWNRLQAQLLWDPNIGRDAVAADFYSNYYGAAGATINQYFSDLWQELLRPEIDAAGISRITALRAQLIAAQSQVSGDNQILARINRVLQFHDALPVSVTQTNLMQDGDFETTVLADGSTAARPDVWNDYGSGSGTVMNPLTGTLPRPTSGSNYYKNTTGTAAQYTGGDYVLEAGRTHVDMDVYPTTSNGSIQYVIDPLGESISVWQLQVINFNMLTLNQWNHVSGQWMCPSGAQQEYKPVGVLLTGNNCYFDNVKLTSPTLSFILDEAFDIYENGVSEEYYIRLDKQPWADVTVHITPDSNLVDLGFGPGISGDCVFTLANWSTPQKITVSAIAHAGGSGISQLQIEHRLSSEDVRYDKLLKSISVSYHDTCGSIGYLEGDFNHDCYVNLCDMAVIAQQWMQQYSFADLAVIANNWLKCSDNTILRCEN